MITLLMATRRAAEEVLEDQAGLAGTGAPGVNQRWFSTRAISTRIASIALRAQDGLLFRIILHHLGQARLPVLALVRA